MKTIIAIFCCVVVASASVLDEFETFKARHNKVYRTKTEHGKRLMTFAKNLAFINKHNEEAALGKHTFRVAVNEFADLTNEEWRDHLGLNYVKEPTRGLKQFVSKKVAIPDEVDWRTEGYVTEVKDQKQCGSCWAFSATGSMEGAVFKAEGNLISLSEQNLVDCDSGSGGCNGGLMDTGFQYGIENGLNTEADYPYEARDMTCRFDANNQVVKIKSFEETKTRDEVDLATAVAEVGPVSVAIDAGQISFQFYSDGVYYDASCHQFLLNHGVLAVGYGTEGGEDYFLVKNSWGAGWGDAGYIKMSRGRSNNCGIATDASYAIA